MASVDLESVSKNFGAVSVLRDISLSIESGKFVALVGPSGCGKSTLLRMIAGLEDVSAGTIKIADRRVNDVPSKDRDISMVFQSYALYPHMSVKENMAFSLKIRSTPTPIVEERVAKAAEILELTGLLDRHPRQLSGGQRQRVAMGRAIVRDPAVFLFDEPLSNLDATLRVQMRAEIKELHHRLGNTMIYVTHDQVEALSMADIVVVMRGGKIEQAGPPLKLYDEPANIFVAQFIGSPAMNILYGETVIEDGGPAVRLKGGDVIALPRHVKVAPNKQVAVGLRPNVFSLGGDGLRAQVVVTEALGAETQIVARLRDTSAKPLILQFNQRMQASPGDELRLTVDTDGVHLFDAETHMRIQ
jgi:multiple sugar transport system ATP-binding protein